MDTKMIVLTNGKAFIDGKLIKRDILIDNGKIAVILNNEIVLGNVETIDCTGKIILPGIIDAHVHVREPGNEHKETYFTAGKAAAAGGITTILDMPNNKPPVLRKIDLDNKAKLSKTCIVNHGFYIGAANNAASIKKVNNPTKIYMDVTTGNMKIEQTDRLQKLFLASSLVAVHAEEDNVHEAVRLAGKTRKRLYIAHLSSATEVKWLKFHKRHNVFIEVCPHHLFLTHKNDPFHSVKPPIKSKNDQKALWAGIKSGLIDTIGSDHAPHTKQEKRSKVPPFGMPGLETLLPLMLNAVNKRMLSIPRLVQLCCENPAKIFKLKNKGHIKMGYDADLTIIDLKLRKKVENKNLQTKCGWSVWDGKMLKGWPVMTIVNGNIVFKDGEVKIKNKGKLIEWD